MSLKLFILLTTYALLVHGNDVERKDNAESYITKEAAKELNKLSARGKQQDLAYDEILDQFLSVQQSGDDDDEEKTLFEKKYFDYLPNDLDSEDVTDEDATLELVNGDVLAKLESRRRVNSRKFKRDLTSQERAKRQKFRAYPSFNSLQSRIDTNPWHPQNMPGKLHPPSNFYLPAKPGVNNPQPPHNPVPDPFNNRITPFDEDDSDQRIWGIVDNRRPNSIAPPRQPSQTQRPTQTTRRPYEEPNSVNYPGSEISGDVDIEYPPDIFDEKVKLTTRAPLRRPTPSAGDKNSFNRNQSGNRQTKPGATTTRTPPTTTRQPNRVTNGRKQNTAVPACVLAIVNCCSRYDDRVQTRCFERYNCNASFFGQKACSPDIKESAFREVEKFSRK